MHPVVGDAGGGAVAKIPPIGAAPPAVSLGGGGLLPSLGKSPVLGSFKKGGKVKETGAYKLEKGEEVIPADKKEAAEEQAERDSEYRAVYLKRKHGKS